MQEHMKLLICVPEGFPGTMIMILNPAVPKGSLELAVKEEGLYACVLLDRPVFQSELGGPR